MGAKHYGEHRCGWAIADDEDGRLISAAFFRNDGHTPIHLWGIRTAIFSSRAAARNALRRVKAIVGSARVVKVAIKYEVQS